MNKIMANKYKYIELGKYLYEIESFKFKMSNKWMDAQDRLYSAKLDYLKKKAIVDNRPKTFFEWLFR